MQEWDLQDESGAQKDSGPRAIRESKVAERFLSAPLHTGILQFDHIYRPYSAAGIRRHEGCNEGMEDRIGGSFLVSATWGLWKPSLVRHYSRRNEAPLYTEG